MNNEVLQYEKPCDILVHYVHDVHKIKKSQGESIMEMIAKGVAEVRSNFSVFLDEADKRPALIKRRRTNYLVIPDTVLLEAVPLKIKLFYEYDEEAANTPNVDGAYVTTCDIFESVFGWGDTKEEAYESFKEGLIGFCQLAYNDFDFFSKDPTRKTEILPVIKIMSILSKGGEVDSLIEEVAEL